jgi:CHAT domain-containing protein/Flp pilus assembly protein TadD
MSLGTCLYSLGDLKTARGELETSLSLFQHLVDSEARHELRPELAQTRMNLGNCLLYLGDLKTARGEYETSLSLYQHLVDSEAHHELRPDFAKTRMNLGVCLSDLGDLKAARGEYEASLSLYQHLVDSEAHHELRPDFAKTRMNLGLCLYSLGDLKAARGELETSRSLYQHLVDTEARHDLRPELAQTRMNLGLCLSDLGDLKAARGEYEASLSLYQHLVDTKARHELRPGLAQTRMNLGLCLYSLGDLKAARGELETSRSLYQHLVDTEARHDLRPELAQTRMNLGLCLSDLGDLKAARGEYEASLSLYQHLVDTKARHDLRPELAQTRMNLGICLSDLGDLKAARGELETSRSLYQHLVDTEARHDLRLGLAITRLNLGTCFSELGDYLATETEYQASLSELQKLEKEGKLFLYAIKLIRVIADWHRRPQRSAGADKPRAFELAKLGLDWLDTLLKRISDTGKTLLLEQNLSLFYLATDLALELNQPDQAYLILERSKSRILVEQMLRERAEPGPQVAEELRQQYHQLRQRLRELVNQLAPITAADEKTLANGTMHRFFTSTFKGTEYRPPQEQQRLEQELAEVEQALEKVYRNLAEQDPAFAEAIQPRPLEVEQIKQLLPAQTLAIAFEQRPDALYLYAITAKAIEKPLRVALNRQQLDERVNTFKANLTQDEIMAVNDISEWLTEQLAPSIKQLLKPVQEILFIPHQLWHLLPLHLIQIDGKPLSCPVRYIPSLQVLRLIHEREQANSGKGCIVAVANPDGSLPGIQKTAQTIKNNYRPIDTLLKDQQANLNAVRQHLNKAQHGHMLCHGYFQADLKAGLNLADGDLQTKELFTSVRLDNARMLILTACETAQIQPTLGDEYMGLVSSFLFAGAHNVLAALWRVEVGATLLLMEDFYQGLVDGLSPTGALQRAQGQLQEMDRQTVGKRLHLKRMEIRKLPSKPYNSPYYWSGFVLVGDGR